MKMEEKMAEHFETVIDRNLYRQIKRMDRKHTNDVFRYIYEQGWNDAVSENKSGADLEKIRAEISAVKGIGEKRLDEIMKIIGANL